MKHGTMRSSFETPLKLAQQAYITSKVSLLNTFESFFHAMYWFFYWFLLQTKQMAAVLTLIQAALKVLSIIRLIKKQMLYSFGTWSHLSGSPCPIYHLEKIYKSTERKERATGRWQ